MLLWFRSRLWSKNVKPENYGKKFYGPSTLRVGLEKSRNLMTVRIAQSLGVSSIVKFSKNLGIYKNPEELLSISLGSAETTLLKLTSAYSSFVNGGKLVEPILIDRIQDSEGNTIINNDKNLAKLWSFFLSEGIQKLMIIISSIFTSDCLSNYLSLRRCYQRGTGKIE